MPKGGGLDLAVDAGVQGQLDDLLLIGKRRVGHGHRQRAEVEVEKQASRNDGDTEEKAQKDFAETAATTFFRH